MATASATAATPRKPLYTHLYVQVLTAIVLGILLGHFYPDIGAAMKPLGDGFIKLIKMLIAPIIFCTVVHGIASMEDMKKVGRVGLKALIYFEIVTTLALIVGLIVVNILQPGVGMNTDVRSIDTKSIQVYTTKAGQQSTVEFLMHIIPNTVVGAFAEGEILQVLFFAILFAFALSMLGERGRPVLAVIDIVAHAFFGIVGIIMKAAPIGAFGAMAFTIGKYGVGTLANLAALVGTFYLTSLLFVVVVLGLVARVCGFSIFRLIAYLKAELLLVLGTSSSESALPSLIEKLERAGCPKSIVGLVVPTGYSFNLDGTNIYMTLAALFIAQACNVELTLGQQLLLLGVAMLSSKGAAGVTGAGFITLAATLSIVPSVPVAGMALILGVDRFMSECRSLTNFIGNAVATIVVSRWEGRLDQAQFDLALAGRSPRVEDMPAAAIAAE